MTNTASGLHELETGISELSKKKSRTLTELSKLIEGFDYENGMEKDIRLLQQMLGEDFISSFAGIGRGLVIDKEKLLDIEKKMLSTLSPIECRILMPEIQKLRYRPFRDLLKSYTDYVNSLAERLGKQIQTLEITGGEMQVDTEKYSDFAKSLTHIFRNALDHGIEAPEERMAAGKDEFGNITCVVAEV